MPDLELSKEELEDLRTFIRKDLPHLRAMLLNNQASEITFNRLQRWSQVAAYSGVLLATLYSIRDFFSSK